RALAATSRPLLSPLPLHAALPISIRREPRQILASEVANLVVRPEQRVAGNGDERRGAPDRQGDNPPDRDRQFPLHGPSSRLPRLDRKSTRLNSSHVKISYAVFCLQ